MPVAEFPGGQSWGYNPSLPFAIEQDYGGQHALANLIDKAHSMGIAIIMDVVYNHFGPTDLDLWRFDGWSENDGGEFTFITTGKRAPLGEVLGQIMAGQRYAVILGTTL